MNYLIDSWYDISSLESLAIRSGFWEWIFEAAQLNRNIVVLNADLPGSLKVHKFAKAHPKRFIQVGVAEQNMAGIGAGLAHVGKIPFITSFAAFSPGLNFSKIRLAAMSHLSLKVVASHYGLNVWEDGASAQMESDVAMMRALPECIIINPADYHQAVQAVHAMADRPWLDYLRVTRAKFPVFLQPDAPFEIGKAQKLLEGEDVTIIATGSMVYESLMASKQLIDSGVSVDFLNIHTIKPIDEKAIIESASKTRKVIVIEEHNVIGGLGDEVASVLSQNLPTPLLKIGIEDTFGESGSHRELWIKYGLDRDILRSRIEKWMI